MSNKNGSEAQACTERYSEITYADLPLSCPPRDKRLWDAHPRVYLPIEDVGQVSCSYCGTRYVLKGFTHPEHLLINDDVA